MKAKYEQKIFKWQIAVAVGFTLVVWTYGIFRWIQSDEIGMVIFGMAWPLTVYFNLRSPAAMISEKDVLVIAGIHINIHQIISLEEGKRLGIRVRYLFKGKERISGTAHLKDKNKPRLVADLLSINPGIEVRKP